MCFYGRSPWPSSSFRIFSGQRRLAYAAAVGHGTGRLEEAELAVLLCREHHAIADSAADLARRQVEHGADLASHELFRLAELCDAGADLPELAFAEVDFEAQDAVGLGQILADLDRAHAQVAGLELVELHVGQHRLGTGLGLLLGLGGLLGGLGLGHLLLGLLLQKLQHGLGIDAREDVGGRGDPSSRIEPAEAGNLVLDGEGRPCAVGDVLAKLQRASRPRAKWVCPKSWA